MWSVRLVFFIIMYVVFLFGTCQLLYGQNIRYVRAGSAGKGTSWADASGSLQAMIDASTSGDQIWVTAGEYQPQAGKSFELIKEDVRLFGGFPSSGSPTMDNRDWLTYKTILRGNQASVIRCYERSNATVIDGFTITGSHEPEGGFINGGGINNASSSPLLRNLIITDNHNTGLGGGIYNTSSSPTIMNVLITKNVARDGAGICNASGSHPKLINVTITGNSATFIGAGIDNFTSSRVEIQNCIIWDNDINGDTGHPRGSISIDNQSSLPTIVSSLIANSGGSTSWNSSYGIDGGGNIDVDPHFTDPVQQIFTLQPGSPAINWGNNQLYTAAGGSITTDHDLAYGARLSGCNIDMGAFEAQGQEACIQASNGVLYVRKGSTGDGSSWDNALGELSKALDWARTHAADWTTNPLEIWVSAGTYQPTPFFAMVENVRILGGFSSNGSPQRNERNWSTNVTVLRGTGNNRVINNNNNGLTAAAMLDGFTITNGYTVISGAGINNANVSPSFANLKISGNRANGFGGGIYNENGSKPTFTDCIVENNRSGQGGGGVANSASSPTFTNSIIRSNATSVVNRHGGGVYNTNASTPRFINVQISGNSAHYYGGGMMSLAGSNAVFLNVTISGNSASNGGNGIYGNNSLPTLHNSIIYGNGGSDVVGGIHANSANNIIHGITMPEVDPFFRSTDPFSLDYLRLAENSPAIDFGNDRHWETIDGSTLDLDGNPRIYNHGNGGVIDLGAYEFQGDPGGIVRIGPDQNNIIYVNRQATGGVRSGDSWENALNELADALKWAHESRNNNLWTSANPLQIWVANGTYNPMYSPRDGANFADEGRDNAFLLVKDVQVYGGFVGGETSVDQRQNLPSAAFVTGQTVLSGDVNGDDTLSGVGESLNLVNRSDNTYHVVVSTNDIGVALLDGFQISGGGSQSAQETLSVDGVTIVRAFGGGIYNESSQLKLSNIAITGNMADQGGGIYTNSSSYTLSNGAIHRNLAVSTDGGGVYHEESSPIWNDVSVFGNFASRNGGGIHNLGSSPYMTKVIVMGNEAISGGGGIYNSAADPVLYNFEIVNNGAAGPGGGMVNINSSPIMTNGKITGNRALQRGGALINYTLSFPVLTNVTVSGNMVTQGINGGIANIQTASPIIKNSIVWGNGGQNIQNQLRGTINSTSSHNLIEGDQAIGNIEGIPTGLSPQDIFINYETATPSHPIPAGNFRLKGSSIAVNKGNNIVYWERLQQSHGRTGTMPTDPGDADWGSDLDGNPRVRGHIIDLGAYESMYLSQQITGVTDVTKTYGDLDFMMGAASSGLALSFTSADTDIAAVVGGQLRIVGVGNTVITVSQPGNLEYASAIPVTFTLTVVPKTLTVADAEAVGRNYDGTTLVAIAGAVLTGIVGTDEVSLSAYTSGTASAVVGDGLAVTTQMELVGTDRAKYLLVQPQLTIAITKAPLVVTATDDTITYNGVAYSGGNDVSYAGFVADDDVEILDGELVYSGTSQGAIDVGSYMITPGGLTSDYYTIEFRSGTLTIHKEQPTITAQGVQSHVYDGTAKYVSATASPEDLSELLQFSPQRSFTNVGVHRVRVYLPESANYLGAERWVDFSITPAAQQGLLLADRTETYNGHPHTLTVSGEAADATVSYTIDGGPGNSATRAGSYTVTAVVSRPNYADVILTGILYINKATAEIRADAVQQHVYDGQDKSVLATLNHDETDLDYSPQQSYTDAGSYTITITASETANYRLSTKEVTLRIDPAQILELSLPDQSYLYDGSPKSLMIVGTLPDGTTVYYANNSRTDVGTQEVSATLTGENYQTLVLTGQLTITPALISDVELDDATFVYDGTTRSIDISGELPAGSSLSYTIDGSPGNQATNAGTYIIVATISGANYQTRVVTAKLTIGKAQPSISAAVTQQHIYDGTAKYVDATASAEELSEFLQFSPQRSFTNVGVHHVRVYLTERTNYLGAERWVDFSITPAAQQSLLLADRTETYNGEPHTLVVRGEAADATISYTINGEPGNSATHAGSYTVKALVSRPNYADVTLTGTLYINKATAEIRADALQEHVYDGQDKSVLAMLNHDEATLTYSPQQSYMSVGDYAITLSSVETANYHGTSRQVTLRILPASQQGLTFGARTEIYNGQPHAVFVQGFSADATVRYTIDGEAGNMATDAGTYKVVAVVDRPNFEPEILTTTLTIDRAVAHILGDENQVHLYDGEAKTLTIILNHEESELAYVPSAIFTDAGTYAIEVSAAQSTNYEAVTKTFTLRIDPANIVGVSLVASSHVYDGTSKSLTIVGALPPGTTVYYANNSRMDVGTQLVTATITGSDYRTVILTAPLTITPAELWVSAHSERKLFGSTDPTLTYTVEGQVAGGQQEEVITGALQRTAGESEGDYTIGRGSLSVTDNYALRFEEGTLSIHKGVDMQSVRLNGDVQGGEQLWVSIQLYNSWHDAYDTGSQIRLRLEKGRGFYLGPIRSDRFVVREQGGDWILESNGEWLPSEGYKVEVQLIGDGSFVGTSYLTVSAWNPANSGTTADRELRADIPVQEGQYSITASNVFTPNGDGINDTFHFEGLEWHDRAELTVLNRYGDQVYKDMDYKNDWTAPNVQDGTYFYVLEVWRYSPIQGRAIKSFFRGSVLIKKQ